MIIALNNKCNLTKKEFEKYQKELQTIKTEQDLILCPSSIYLSLCNLNHIKLGSQNVSKNKTGAHTGEISASQLASLNVKYCIVGHSERRQELQESSLDTNLKIKNLLAENITPILCVGETKNEKDANKTLLIIEEQINTALTDLTTEEIHKIIFAYEPIWSIGTGMIPTTEDISSVLSLIKKLTNDSKTLYGGSANEENITYLKECKLIDGYLLGGLSLKADKLKKFLEKLL